MARGPFSSTDYLAGTAPDMTYPLTLYARARAQAAITTAQEFLDFQDSTTSTVRNQISLGFTPGSADGLLFLRHSSGTTSLTHSPSTEITAGQWHSCIAVCANTSSRFVYLDNNASSENTATRTFANAPDYATIGARRNAAAVFGEATQTVVAEAALWGVALTSEERQQLIDGASPIMVRPDALRWYVPCLGPASGGATEWFGGRNMSLNGSVASVDHPRVIYPRRRTHVYVPSAGGGYAHPTLSNATLLPAGGNNYQPRVSYSF